MAALSCTIWEMRHALLEYQVVLFLAVFVPCFLLLKRFVRGASNVLPQVSTVCGAISVAAFLVLGLLNLSRPGFLWHDEASILSVAAAYVHGGPLYHDRAATELYSLLYGPCTFLLWVPILKVFAHPMPAIRVFGLALNIANLALLYLILRLRLSRPLALAFLPVAIAYLLFSVSPLFGVRGDPALLLCFTLALVCVERLRWLPAALASGVCCGLALDCKLTVAPVVCLLIALLFRRYGWKATLLSAAMAIATAASLFLLPGVSARNYLEWLALSGRQGLLRELFFGNVLAVAFLLAPGLLLCARALPRQIRDSGPAVRVLFLAALCSCILTGSKDGAGPWHLWPMLPFLVLWITIMAARCGVGGPRDKTVISGALKMVAAIAIAATVVTLRQGYRDLRIIHRANEAAQRADEAAAEEELSALVKRYPGRNLAMGYGADAGDWRSAERFELPLMGQNYFLDENALVESIKAGVPMAPAMVRRVLGCNDLWLVPHGEAPFASLRGGVLPGAGTPFLFPDALRLHFAQAYVRIEVGATYDVWACPASSSKSL